MIGHALHRIGDFLADFFIQSADMPPGIKASPPAGQGQRAQAQIKAGQADPQFLYVSRQVKRRAQRKAMKAAMKGMRT